MTWNQKKPPSSDEPRILAEAGLSLRDFNAFAAAAVRFYTSELRRELLLEDLIEIQEPTVEPDLRFVLWVEIEGQISSLLFFRNPLDSERGEDGTFRVESHWEIAFLLPEELEAETREIWSAGLVPQTPDGRCPIPLQHADMDEWFPDAGRLGFLTGLLTVLAATTEADLDSGQWQKDLAGEGETLLYRLRLPEHPEGSPRAVGPPDPRLQERQLRDLQRMMKEREIGSVEELKASLAEIESPDQIPHPEPVTPSEQAQEMIDAALWTRGRSRLKLARAALRVWPDCAEAYVLQAELRQSPEARLDLYRRGVAAGERALGPVLDEKAGELWDVLSARPYLRALEGLAETLLGLDQTADAAAVLREMLGLETRDPLHMRDMLTTALLALGRDTETRELLDRYGEDSAWPAYSRALLEFRQGGDSLESRRQLRKALTANSAVPLYLLDLVVLPTEGAPAGLPEPVGQAITYSIFNLEVWQQTPGALDWLEDLMVDFEPGGAGPKRRPGRKAKKRARKRQA